jgi:hypothetical protein
MTDYKATPEQWAQVEAWMAIESEYSACVLELRARIEALESNTKQWRIDHFKLANTCASMAPGRFQFFNSLLPDSDISKPCPNPSQIGRSLVERVAIAISTCEDSSCWDDEAVNWTPEARAAIREVTAWMREQQDGDLVAATVLEREAKR